MRKVQKNMMCLQSKKLIARFVHSLFSKKGDQNLYEKKVKTILQLITEF